MGGGLHLGLGIQLHRGAWRGKGEWVGVLGGCVLVMWEWMGLSTQLHRGAWRIKAIVNL